MPMFGRHVIGMCNYCRLSHTMVTLIVHWCRCEEGMWLGSAIIVGSHTPWWHWLSIDVDVRKACDCDVHLFVGSQTPWWYWVSVGGEGMVLVLLPLSLLPSYTSHESALSTICMYIMLCDDPCLLVCPQQQQPHEQTLQKMKRRQYSTWSMTPTRWSMQTVAQSTLLCVCPPQKVSAIAYLNRVSRCYVFSLSLL